MKKKLTIIGLLGFTFLFGCNVSEKEVEAGIPEGWALAEKLEGNIEKKRTVTLKHLETGCYYVGYGDGGITQMYNKDGLPYCD